MKLINLFKHNFIQITCPSFQGMNLGAIQHDQSISFYTKADTSFSKGVKRKLVEDENSNKRTVRFNLNAVPSQRRLANNKSQTIKPILSKKSKYTNANAVLVSKNNSTRAKNNPNKSKLFTKRTTRSDRKSASIIIVSLYFFIIIII
jgi:hypothetical protein